MNAQIIAFEKNSRILVSPPSFNVQKADCRPHNWNSDYLVINHEIFPFCGCANFHRRMAHDMPIKVDSAMIEHKFR